MTDNPRKVLILIIAVVFFGLIVIFGLNRFNRYISGPSLETISIYDYMAVDTSLLAIEGVAKNTSLIIINGKRISLTEDLEFKKKIVLPSGHSIIEIDVIDGFGHNKRYHYNISNNEIKKMFPKTLTEAQEIETEKAESNDTLTETTQESINPN